MRAFFFLFVLLFAAKTSAQTGAPTKGCAPLEVNFTAPAGSTSWVWDFKDGGSSNLKNPTNIFTTPGTYVVEFRTSAGGPVAGTVTVTVYPKPDVMITATPESGCRPLPVQFTDVSTTTGDIQILSQSWTFGDGGSASGTSPQHTYALGGTYSVSLELTTNYPTCNVTQVFTDKIKVSNRPQVGIATNPTPPSACEPPLVVTFTNTTPNTAGLTWAWDFGNGNTSAQYNPSSSQTYAQNGNYLVTMTATDALGCSATATVPVNVGAPTADFSVPDTICFGSAITMINNTFGLNYAWSFGPNATPSFSNDFEPKVLFTQPGLQTITLQVTAPGGCTGMKTVQVFVDKPDASFTAAPTYSCDANAVFNFNATSPAAVGWAWTFSNGSNASTQSVIYNWENPDTTGYTSLGGIRDTVRLVVTNPSGCTAESFKIDTVWLPNARFMPDKQHGCAPLTVTFADSSRSRETIVQWEWLLDDGSAPILNATNASVTHTFAQAGEYDVRLVIRNARGCVDTSYIIRIEVGEAILGDFSADKTEVCPGDTVQFTNLTNDPRVDGWHFSSESDQQWHCYQNANPTWSYTTETGDLDVMLTVDYNGCLTTVTKTGYIKVKGPIAKIHYQTTCENSRLFEFTDMSSDATGLTWHFDGLTSTATHFSHEYLTSTPDTVVLVAVNATSGCPASSDTAIVCPTKVRADFDLPFIVCGNAAPYQFDGTKSDDVNAVCYKGYTWYFDYRRPLRTEKSVTELVFTEEGFHRIWLEVEDVNGCKDTLQDSVQVYMRRPMFSLSDSLICLPGLVSFNDQSTADTTIVSWEWDFGDGTTGTGQNPVHTYTEPPANGQVYMVTLTIRDKAGCATGFSRNIILYKPTSSIVTFPFPPNLCEGGEVIFSASDYTSTGSSLSWAWNFGDGGTATGKTVQHQFNQHGAWPVELIYTEIASGCTDTTGITVNVQSKPDAKFTSDVDGQSIICYPAQIVLNDASQTNYPTSTIWNWAVGANAFTTTGNMASVAFPKGTYSVQMIAVTSFGCADTTERAFTIVGPEGNFTMDKNAICVGDAIKFTLKDTVDVSSWSWNFGDGTTMNGGSPVSHAYPFSPPGFSTVAKLILKGENDACQIALELPISFSKINADFSVPPSSCFGVPIPFTDLSTDADQHQWTFGDGGNTSAAPNPTHTYGAAGTYQATLIVTDLPLGCRDTLSRTVAVTGLPNLVAYGDTICPGDTATIGVLSPLPGATYVWSPAGPLVGSANGPEVQVVVQQTTNFSVTVTDAAGCSGADTTVVFVPSVFDGARDLDTLVAEGAKVELPVLYDPAFNYAWSPTRPDGTGPWTATPKDSSLHFMLIVTDNFGCTERDYEFHVRMVRENVLAPTAFTPDNGDDENDGFRLISDPTNEQGKVEVLTMRIYDRWGEVIFEGTGTDKTVVWDGTKDGKALPSDVYVWVAVVKYQTGKEETRKGEVTLLR